MAVYDLGAAVAGVSATRRRSTGAMFVRCVSLFSARLIRNALLAGECAKYFYSVAPIRVLSFFAIFVMIFSSLGRIAPSGFNLFLFSFYS